MHGPDDLVILGPMTLREVFCVDAMSALRQTFLKLRGVSGRSDGGIEAGAGDGRENTAVCGGA